MKLNQACLTLLVTGFGAAEGFVVPGGVSYVASTRQGFQRSLVCYSTTEENKEKLKADIQSHLKPVTNGVTASARTAAVTTETPTGMHTAQELTTAIDEKLNEKKQSKNPTLTVLVDSPLFDSIVASSSAFDDDVGVTGEEEDDYRIQVSFLMISYFSRLEWILTVATSSYPQIAETESLEAVVEAKVINDQSNTEISIQLEKPNRETVTCKLFSKGCMLIDFQGFSQLVTLYFF